MSGYDLVRPCDNCPFRIEPRFYLGEDRAIEIADALRSGSEFHCHKTIEYDDYDYAVKADGAQFCAGALTILENSEGPNQMMRIAERLRMYDHTKLANDVEVYEDLDEFIDAMQGI